MSWLQEPFDSFIFFFFDMWMMATKNDISKSGVNTTDFPCSQY